MLNTPPNLSSLSHSLKTWERLGPLNIDDIIKYSDFPVIIDEEISELGFKFNGKVADIGQTLKNTGKINGIARDFSIESSQIFEGLIYRDLA